MWPCNMRRQQRKFFNWTMGVYGWRESRCTSYTTSDLRNADLLTNDDLTSLANQQVGGVTGSGGWDRPLDCSTGSVTYQLTNNEMACSCNVLDIGDGWSLGNSSTTELYDHFWSCTGTTVKSHGPVAQTGVVLLRNLEDERHYGNDLRGRMALRSRSFSNCSFLVLLRPRLDIYLAVKHAKLVWFHILQPNVWSEIAF